jgi:outer membrane receptor protein involved in Fe transport
VVVHGARLADASDTRSATRTDVAPSRVAAPGPASLADALTALPGISIYDDQGTRAQPTLDVRGFSLSPVVGVPQGVSVFLDGVRVNEADAQEVNFDLLPLDVIARAELVRGPQPVFGKNSLAGALLLTTRRGDSVAAYDAETEVGAFGYRAAHVSASGGTGRLAGLVMLRASDEDGWRADTPARTRLLFASGSHRTARDDARLTLLAGHNRLYQAGSLPESWLGVDRRANFTSGDYYEPTLWHVSVGLVHRFGVGARLNTNVFFRSNDTERFNVNADAPSVLSRTAARSVGLTSEVAVPLRPLGRPVNVVAGIEVARHSVGYRVYQRASADAEPDDDCNPESGLCERAQVNEGDAAAYAQVVADLPGHLSLSGSARADWVRVPFRDRLAPENDGTSVFRRVSPRLGLSWQPNARAQAFASVGTGFRAPAALELACADESSPCPLPFALGDDPPLAPVRVYEGEVGGETSVVRDVRLSATAWRAIARDEIVFVASRTAAGFFRNVHRTSRSGVELTARGAFAHGLRASASYSWLDSRWESSAQLASANPNAAPVRSGDPMPLSPAHRATATVGAARLAGRWLLDGELGVRAVSRQRLRGDEAGQMPPLPGYATAQLRLAADRGHFGVSASVANLTGSRASSFGTYGLNAIGVPGAPPPATPRLERFLTPLTPRTLTVSVAVHR